MRVFLVRGRDDVDLVTEVGEAGGQVVGEPADSAVSLGRVLLGDEADAEAAALGPQDGIRQKIGLDLGEGAEPADLADALDTPFQAALEARFDLAEIALKLVAREELGGVGALLVGQAAGIGEDLLDAVTRPAVGQGEVELVLDDGERVTDVLLFGAGGGWAGTGDGRTRRRRTG